METNSENNSSRAASSMLSDAVYNAELLLNYSTEHGLDIQQDWIATIIAAKKCEESNSWDTETEINFWMAYKGLSKIVRPVSVESLKSTQKEAIKNPNFLQKLFKNKERVSFSRRSVRSYLFWALFWILFMLSIQVFSLKGTTLVNNIQGNTARIEEIDNRRDEIQLLLNADSELDRRAELEKQRLIAEKDKLDQEIRSSIELLKPWVNTIRTITFSRKNNEHINNKSDLKRIGNEIPDSESEKITNNSFDVDDSSDTGSEISLLEELGLEEFEDKEIVEENIPAIIPQEQTSFAENTINTNIGTIQEAQNFTQILQLYLLPLLYGLIGGYVFILRGLTYDIKNLIFSRYSKIKYSLRMFLGALAGLIVGLLWGDIESRHITFLESLSTGGLAFLAGYGVEYVFDGLDKIVSSIVKSKPEKLG